MRYLLLAVLFAFPATALAGPCGQPGYNGPLNAETRSTTQGNGQQGQGAQGSQAETSSSSYNSLNASRQAYPH